MALSKLDNVPLIPQPTDGVCWYVCARMLAEWRKKVKGGLGSMIDPQNHKECKDMFDNNRGWPPPQVALLGSWLNMKTRTIAMDFASVTTALTNYGPLWACGYKTWAGSGHYHVIVILGVADTGVLIHDPEPLRVGTYAWKTWDAINKYLTLKDDIDYNFLTCP